MTVVDRQDELQASSVGRRECSQHAAANGSQTHGRPCRHIQSALPTGDGLWPLRGGATVLKVGGTILRAERAKKIFLTPPLFGQWGGTKYCLDS